MLIDDIYALCDQALLHRFAIELDRFLEIARRFNVEIVQYRNKEGSFEEIKDALKYLRERFDGILLINDFYSLATLCDGVHLGQEDLIDIMKSFGLNSKADAITLIRKVFKAKIVGLSTHNLAEVTEANGLDLDYIGLGAYRDTQTKDVSYVLGNELSEIAKSSCHKVVAIGGIRVFEPIESVWKRAIGSDLLNKGLSYA